jgi:hypothetical protein
MRNRRDEMVELILSALHKEGIKFQKSIKSTEILSYHLISLADSNCREFILKLRAFKNRIKISSWNSDPLFEFDLENNVVRYCSKSKKIEKIMSILEKDAIVGPKMSCYEYAGYLFSQNHPEWNLHLDGKGKCSYTNMSTTLIAEPFFLELRAKDERFSERKLRIAHYRKIQDDFWFSTYSKGLSDILLFLDTYKELDEILKGLMPWSINGMFHPIL